MRFRHFLPFALLCGALAGLIEARAQMWQPAPHGTPSVGGGGGGGACAISSNTTWNPADKSANVALSNGNCTATLTGSGAVRSTTSHARSSKLYFELIVSVLNNPTTNTQLYGGFGGAGAPLTSAPGITVDGNVSAGFQFDWFGANAQYFKNGSLVQGVSNCLINPGGATAYEGFAVDLANNHFWCTTNGTNWGPDSGSTDNPATNTGGMPTNGWSADPIYIMMGGGDVGDAVIISTTSFHFSVPSGFTAWN